MDAKLKKGTELNSAKRRLEMNITMKQISMMVFGSVAWLVCAVALPMHQGPGTDSLTAKVANLVIAPAFASSTDDEAKSDDDESKDNDEGKDDESKDDGESDDTSSSYDFSSATLVCVSQSSVLTALNFTSSESEAKSDDDESKDDEAKSDDDESSESEATSDDGESSDDGAKSDDDDESKDDEAKSDDDESDESSTTLSASFIQGLPACTVFGASSAAGVWVPSSAIIFPTVSSSGTTTTSGGTTTTSGGTTTTSGGATTTSGGSVTLNGSVATAYFSQLASGGSGLTGTPSSTLESYREIRGE